MNHDIGLETERLRITLDLGYVLHQGCAVDQLEQQLLSALRALVAGNSLTGILPVDITGHSLKVERVVVPRVSRTPVTPEQLVPVVVSDVIVGEEPTHISHRCDVTVWFVQASDDDITQLHAAGWEAVNGLCFSLLAVGPDMLTGGSRCRLEVHAGAAMDWLQQHRPGLWAELVCAEYGIGLCRTTQGWNPWHWRYFQTGQECSEGFASKREAARSAVETLKLPG